MAQVFNFPKSVGVGENIAPDSSPSLGPGAKGLAVREVQLRLQQLRYGLAPTGVYDDATVDAVRQFQRDSALTPTGSVDVATWRKLALQTVDPLPQGQTVNATVSRPGVEQGGAAARSIDIPGVVEKVTSTPWLKWGLIVAGVLGALYLLQSKDSGLSGYRRLLDEEGDDPEPQSEPRVVGHGRTSKSAARSVVGDKRCPRVPSEEKLKDAEELEAA